MKKGLFAFGIIGALLVGYLAIGSNSPFPPWFEDITGDVTFSNGVSDVTIESSDITAGSILESDLLAYDDDALHPMRVAKGSFAVAGYGAVGSGSTALGFTLPAGAILWDGVIFGKLTVQTTTGNPTIKIGCTDDTTVVLNATGTSAGPFYLNTGSMTAINPTGTSASAKYVSSACTPFATVASGSFSQGIIDVFVQYYEAD